MANTNAFIDALKESLTAASASPAHDEVGVVLEAGDGIARISGLRGAAASEMLAFETGKEEVLGVVLNLEEDTVGCMILGDFHLISEGMTVRRLGRILDVSVGDALIGRVVDPLGHPLDGKGKIVSSAMYPIEKIAPGVMSREPVNQPLQTGIKAIDAMIPIGRGQRELIIGDRQTGKTALVIDAIINQRPRKGPGETPRQEAPVICIYVAIGQKESKIARIVGKLQEAGAMEYTIVVLAGVSQPAALSYLAPYAGVSMAEYFMDQGKDVLIVYDDLSKHAVAYRQLSLLLRRPPGREAYPGDIFYLHSRLLERAARRSKEFGGGSITALPIIETQAGDVSAYVPTNVISINDGQIYLESDLFYQGVRPALNVGLSVSRVGSSAQTKAMKKVAGRLRLELAQYRELAAFAQFGSDLDESTKKVLERGKRITEILKQPQYQPRPMEEQVVMLYAALQGLIDDIDPETLSSFEEKVLRYLRSEKPGVLAALRAQGEFTPEIEAELAAAVKDCKTF